jgi:tRNA A-37 threonylcarbamoyl transferase component Bud32
MLVGRFPAISASHKNFQTPREVEQTIRQAGLCIVRRMPAKATLRARLRPTLLARDIIYVLRAADDRSAVSRGVALSPFPTEGKSDSLLYLWSTPAGKRLVKVFTGRSAAARRDRAEAAQRLWRKHGFPVPELYAVSPPGASRPHLVQELVEGPTLRQRLRDDAISLSQKLQEVDQVLSSMRSRHARALAERDARWVHPDANTGNILLAPSGPVWIDLESLPVGDSLDAAAAELAKFALCVAAELGPAHFADIARRMLSHYRGLEAIPRRFCERTLARRLQPLHRWRDRRRKMAHPQTPTKYDLADRWQRALSAQPIAA